MRNLLHDTQPKRILGLKPASWRDIIIIMAIVGLISFFAVSVKAETTEKVVKEQVSIHQENTEKIEALEEKQQRDQQLWQAQMDKNHNQDEFNKTQVLINTVNSIKEAINK